MWCVTHRSKKNLVREKIAFCTPKTLGKLSDSTRYPYNQDGWHSESGRYRSGHHEVLLGLRKDTLKRRNFGSRSTSVSAKAVTMQQPHVPGRQWHETDFRKLI